MTRVKSCPFLTLSRAPLASGYEKNNVQGAVNSTLVAHFMACNVVSTTVSTVGKTHSFKEYKRLDTDHHHFIA